MKLSCFSRFWIRQIIPLIAFILLLSSFAVKAELVEIDNEQLKILLGQGVELVDVRRSDEWASTGVIANSQLATFFSRSGGFDAQAWMKQINGETFKQQPLILICDSGSRSRVIGRWLSDVMGYNKIYNVSDGIANWRKTGNATLSLQEATKAPD